MKIYAALGCNHHLNRVIFEHGYPNHLLSFAYKEVTGTIPRAIPYLILDSGAFTAWQIGKRVDIDAYSDWALRQADKRQGRVLAINLDVIPGRRGREGTEAEKAAAMEQSLRNAERLRRDGLTVMEVFHQGEPLAFLDQLLGRLRPTDVLGISPRKGVPTSSNLDWQATVFRHLLARYGPTRLPRMHALGVASAKMLREFPYFSSDCSSWQSPGMFGRFVNRDGGTKPVAGGMLPHAVGRSGTGTDEAKHYAVRVSLDNLALLERDITSLWKGRGIVFRELW